MAERNKIGIVFDNNPHWTGGTYYILNLISALHRLNDSQKPQLVIFTRTEADFQLVKNTEYPYLVPVFFPENYQIKYTILERGINALSRKIWKKNIIDHRPNKNTVASIFPFNNWTYPFQHYFENIPHKVAWIADFQEHFLPQFFSAKEIESRKQFQSDIVKTKLDLVLSSEDSKQSFYSIFPLATNRVFTLPFAVSHPQFQDIDIDKLLQKFQLKTRYFFAPNQFWKHKNHLVVLKAVTLIKEKYPDIQVAFSGRENDSRNPDYFPGLKKYVEDHGLGPHIKFLGFLDRLEQLRLMEQSIAVIQPSLFEGWSTVVEDAKAMKKLILASHLPVHKEQLTSNALFFDPHSDEELAAVMSSIWNNNFIHPSEQNNYEKNIVAFGENFLKIFS